jgi:tetratricopeptide (TPR) repeat protein
MGTHPDDHADLAERRVETEAALCQVFRALCSIRPLCVLVDDLRAAVPRSVELLEDVLNRTQGLPMLMLAAAPPELDARLFSRLTRVPLGPLSESDAARLAQQLPVPCRGTVAVRALFQSTGGNPGAMMLFEGTPGVTPAGRGQAGVAAPVRLEALQDALLDRLPNGLPSVLRAAAVLGPVFSARWLEGCLAEALPLGSLLQDAAQAGFLESLDENREHYLFSSQGFREGLLARLPVSELRALQGQVARGLGRVDDQGTAVELRVRLLRQLSGQDADPRALAALARREAGMGALGASAETYRRALNTESARFTSPIPEDANRLLTLAAEAVDAVATVDPGEATALLGPVLDRVPPDLAVAARAEALRRRARVWMGAQRFAEAESALTNALEVLGVAEPAQQSLVVAEQAAAMEGRGDLRGALTALGAAAQMLPQPGMVPPWEEYGMFLNIARLCEKLGMPEQASAALQACVDRAVRQGRPRWAARARVQLASILEKRGQIPQWARQLLQAQKEATACGDVVTVLTVLAEQARIHDEGGRSAQAHTAWRTVLEGALLAGRKDLVQRAQQKLAPPSP